MVRLVYQKALQMASKAADTTSIRTFSKNFGQRRKNCLTGGLIPSKFAFVQSLNNTKINPIDLAL